MAIRTVLRAELAALANSSKSDDEVMRCALRTVTSMFLFGTKSEHDRDVGVVLDAIHVGLADASALRKSNSGNNAPLRWAQRYLEERGFVYATSRPRAIEQVLPWLTERWPISAESDTNASGTQLTKRGVVKLDRRVSLLLNALIAMGVAPAESQALTRWLAKTRTNDPEFALEKALELHGAHDPYRARRSRAARKKSRKT